jgi:hypothetical protein
MARGSWLRWLRWGRQCGAGARGRGGRGLCRGRKCGAGARGRGGRGLCRGREGGARACRSGRRRLCRGRKCGAGARGRGGRCQFHGRGSGAGSIGHARGGVDELLFRMLGLRHGWRLRQGSHSRRGTLGAGRRRGGLPGLGRRPCHRASLRRLRGTRSGLGGLPGFRGRRLGREADGLHRHRRSAVPRVRPRNGDGLHRHRRGAVRVNLPRGDRPHGHRRSTGLPAGARCVRLWVCCRLALGPTRSGLVLSHG